MAVQWADRVKVSTVTTGTGTLSLGSAVSGFRTFASAVTDGALASGATVYYVIEDAPNWETGTGTYTAGSPDTLTRTVTASSSGGTTAITLSGSAVVYIASTAASLVAIVGTTTNTAASAGYVGEVISSTIATGAATSLTSATAKNVTSISLTAGDWDVWGQITTKPSSTQTIVNFGISTTTNTLPTPSATTGGLTQMSASFTSAGAISLPIAQSQILLSATTTVYLVAQVTFSGTNSAFGFIAARRRR
jgi:hypothetical protein